MHSDSDTVASVCTFILLGYEPAKKLLAAELYLQFGATQISASQLVTVWDCLLVFACCRPYLLLCDSRACTCLTAMSSPLAVFRPKNTFPKAPCPMHSPQDQLMGSSCGCAQSAACPAAALAHASLPSAHHAGPGATVDACSYTELTVNAVDGMPQPLVSAFIIPRKSFFCARQNVGTSRKGFACDLINCWRRR